MRVALIESDERLARTYVRLLERAGHTVRAAAGDLDQHDALRQDGFDVLIVDADSCPSARDLMCELRRCGRREPVILLTRGNVGAACDAHPPFAVLRKPVTKAQLLDAVGRVPEAPAS